jgi:hypothetical protein
MDKNKKTREQMMETKEQNKGQEKATVAAAKRSSSLFWRPLT